MAATFIQFAKDYPKCLSGCKVEVVVESLDAQVATVEFAITLKVGGVAKCIAGTVVVTPAPPAVPKKWELTYTCENCGGKQYRLTAFAKNRTGGLLKAIQADTNICPR